MGGFGLFGIFDTIFPILFIFFFIIIIAVFISAFVRGMRTKRANDNSPRLTVQAFAVAKRMDVSHHTHTNPGEVGTAGGHYTTSSTRYYVTFQVDSGDRLELRVGSSDYGMIVEGDRGNLSFQGTRFISFERI